MIKAILVDDDLLALNNLKYLCGKLGKIEVVGAFEDALSALQFLQQNKVDVLFLDVEMPDFSGMEMAKTARNLPALIFTSAKADYALEAFEYEAIDYIQKPVTLSRLALSLEKLSKIIQLALPTPPVAVAPNPMGISSTIQDFVFVKTGGKLVKIILHEVLFIESTGDYVTFVTLGGKKWVTLGTMKSMEEKIQHPDLLRIHRGYIVNLRHIRGIEDTAVAVGDFVIPVSRAHKQNLLQKIHTI
jgi:two-component system response regulator LytT